MKSITTSFSPAGASLVVLPPVGARVPSAFRDVDVNESLRAELIGEMQRFRGGVYLHDGAILANQLTRDGRHSHPVDENSWHVLTLDKAGKVCACLRYLEEGTARKFEHLWVRHSALTLSPFWGPKLKKAIELEMTFAKREQISFGEVGGWAIAPDRRLTLEPLRTILATYGLLEMLGSCSGIATATHRHGSAPILRKIGLASLMADDMALPPYYDPQYRCEMEVLRFDSRSPNPRFRNWIDELTAYMALAPVICSRPAPLEAPAWDSGLLHAGKLPVPALAGSF